MKSFVASSKDEHGETNLALGAQEGGKTIDVQQEKVLSPRGAPSRKNRDVPGQAEQNPEH